MKKYLLILPIIFICNLIQGQAPSFAWAKSIGNTGGSEIITGLDVDNADNVYIAGEFNGTIDFDPGTGTHNLSTHGGLDIFVAKYTSSGAFVWAYNLGDTGEDGATDLTVDDSANVYISGYYNGSPDMDPGAGVQLMGTNNLSNGFYLKLNSSGLYKQSKYFAGPGLEICRGIAVDQFHNTYVTGTYTQLTIAGTTLIQHGLEDVFIAKFNVSGSKVWVEEIGGGNNDHASAIDVDASGTAYVTGFFSGTDFDIDPAATTYIFSSSGNIENSYLVCINPNGSMEWGNNWGTTSSIDRGEDVVADNATNSYQSANFGGNVGSIARRDQTGAGYWGLPTNTTTTVSMPSLAVDYLNNVYVAGFFAGNLTYGGSTMAATGNVDIFISKFLTNSILDWQIRIGGNGGDAANKIVTGSGNSVFIAGTFSGNVDFNSSASSNYLTSVGSSDMFILRLGQVTTGIDESDPNQNFYVSPNPFINQVTISLNQLINTTYTVQVWSIDGRLLSKVDYKNAGDETQTLDLSNLKPGMYILEIISNGKHAQQKIVKSN